MCFASFSWKERISDVEGREDFLEKIRVHSLTSLLDSAGGAEGHGQPLLDFSPYSTRGLRTVAVVDMFEKRKQTCDGHVGNRRWHKLGKFSVRFSLL